MLPAPATSRLDCVRALRELMQLALLDLLSCPFHRHRANEDHERLTASLTVVSTSILDHSKDAGSSCRRKNL
jgi:hypothetical protein